MKKVILYKSKYGVISIFDSSTEELRDQAYRKLFSLFREKYDLKEIREIGLMKLYKKAEKNNIECVIQFLDIRNFNKYKYEEFEEIEVQ